MDKKQHKRPNFKDLTGQRRGRLLIIGFAGAWGKRCFWNCECECGAFKQLSTGALNCGKTNSCGCLWIERNNNKGRNLLGVKFNDWEVIGKSKNGRGSWICECKCGNTVDKRSDWIVSKRDLRCKECYAKNRIGPNNPNWNCLLSEEDRLDNKRYKRGNGKILRLWREGVFSRDRGVCGITGTVGKVDIHHIEAWNANKDLRYEVNNGITLIQWVHKAFHRLFGLGYNTKEQFEDFKIVFEMFRLDALEKLLGNYLSGKISEDDKKGVDEVLKTYLIKTNQITNDTL